MNRCSFVFTLSLALLICAMPVWGQIVFNSTDIPSTIGAQFSELNSAGSISLDPGPAGANQTWDFQGLSAPVQATLEIIDRSQTPNPAWIPDANHIVRTSGPEQDLGYMYSQITSTFAKFLGTAWQLPESSWVVEWTNDPPSMVFPVHYGDSWMSRLHWEQTIEGVTLIYEDSSWLNVDGWGTVLLDGMDPIQCLRIKNHHHMVATVMGIPMIDEWTWVYEWIAPGYLDVVDMQSEVGGDEHFTTGYFTRTGGSLNAEEPIQIIPLAFELQNPFPNPFNPETTIPYTVNQPMKIELSVFNTLGQKVRTLIDGQVVPGTHNIIWNGTDNAGNQVGAGVYYCRMISSEGTGASQKLLLVK